MIGYIKEYKFIVWYCMEVDDMVWFYGFSHLSMLEKRPVIATKIRIGSF